MSIRQIQSTFSLGELDPKLFARSDFEGYYKGAKTLRNVLVIPQGGVTRRFGLTYLATVVDTGDANEPITNPTEINGLIFDFSPSKSFLIIARPHDRTGTPAVAFDIYLDDALQATVTTTDYTIAQISELYFFRAQDRVLILHEDVQPHQLVRGANDATWSTNAITFSIFPAFDFSIFDGTSYRGPTVTFTPSATSGIGITLTAVNATFTAGHVGGLFTGAGGVMRITAVNGAGTVATGTTLKPFDATTAIKGVDALLEGVAWGDYTAGTPAGSSRGWPSRGCFFQTRLVLANSAVLPNLLWFSSTSDYYNFDDSSSLDVSGFSIGLGSDGNEEVRELVGTKALIALGLQGLHSTSLFIDQPVTPATTFLTEQARSGAADLRAQIVDNQVFYVDKNKQQVNAARYDINASSFDVVDATIFSPQIIDDPKSTAVYRPSSNAGSFYLATNVGGTLGVFQSLLQQTVQAWTLSDTRGYFERVLASLETGYALIRRSISTLTVVTGSATQLYKANADFEAFTDIRASSLAGNIPLFEAVGAYLLIGHDSPFFRLRLTFATAASVSLAPLFEYLDDTKTWRSFTTTDNTSGMTADGSIIWSLRNDVSDWAPQSLTKSLPTNSVTGVDKKFWMRIKRTTAVVATTPIELGIFINQAERLNLERLDFAEYTDATERTTSDADGLVTGLSHLLGHQVFALVDDVPEGPFFVNSNGQITISGQSSNVRVGLNFQPVIEPMPLVVQAAFSQSVYQPKHLKSIYVDYYESLGITVNGLEIPTLKLNELVLDQTPIPATGFFEITPMRGWDPRGTNTISQDLPLPMTLLGIGYRLEVS